MDEDRGGLAAVLRGDGGEDARARLGHDGPPATTRPPARPARTARRGTPRTSRRAKWTSGLALPGLEAAGPGRPVKSCSSSKITQQIRPETLSREGAGRGDEAARGVREAASARRRAREADPPPPARPRPKRQERGEQENENSHASPLEKETRIQLRGSAPAFVRPAQRPALASFRSCLAITRRWISEVPSPIVQSFASR